MVSMKYFLLIFLILCFACSEDEFLERKPHQETAGTYFSTLDGATEAISGIYNILQQQETVARFEMVGEYCSPDMVYAGEPGGNDSPYQPKYMRFTEDENNGNVDNRGIGPYWDEMFTGIYRCNLLLDILEDKENLVDFPEEDRLHIMGEGYFLRGLFEFKLLIVFAGMPQLQDDFGGQLLGLPFYDHVPLLEEFYAERPSLEESWERTADDFMQALELLPLKSEYPADEMGRATSGAAQAMLAKTYLYTEKWEEAFAAAEAVINSGEYWLEGSDGHVGDYTVTRTSKEGMVQVELPACKWMFQPEGDFHGGRVFSVMYTAGHEQSAYPYNYEGNLRVKECGPRAVIAWNEQLQDYTSTGLLWGLYCPTSFFVETAYREAGCVNATGEIMDPRFKLSVISENDSVPYYYENDAIRSQHPDSVLFDAWYNWPCTGYSMWKYFPDPVFTLQAVSPGDYGHDIHYLRYADVLLMAAEAAFHTGRTEKALDYENQVRSRARNSGHTGYPAELTEISLEAIYAERRVELAFEGHAFFDLVRTKRIKSELDRALEYKYVIHPVTGNTATMQFGENFTAGVNEIFPIPSYEVELSEGRISQNPGY